MRLIDADELIEEIKSMKIWLGGKDIFPNEAKESIIQLIEDEPTADDIDKVVEKMEEIEAKYSELSCSVNDITMMREYTAKEQTMALAIEIVKQGKEQNK